MVEEIMVAISVFAALSAATFVFTWIFSDFISGVAAPFAGFRKLLASSPRRDPVPTEVSEKIKSGTVKRLLRHGDASLRLLEEVYEGRPNRDRPSLGSADHVRIRRLEAIQREIREYLRMSIDGEEEGLFEGIRDQSLRLLDEIKLEMKLLEEREPFDGLQDPERSLLVDILQGLEPSNDVVRQKAQQLGDIIKIKHQDFIQLQSDNLRAAVWTRWGVFGTVFFGLLSLALSLSSILGWKWP